MVEQVLLLLVEEVWGRNFFEVLDSPPPTLKIFDILSSTRVSLEKGAKKRLGITNVSYRLLFIHEFLHLHRNILHSFLRVFDPGRQLQPAMHHIRTMVPINLVPNLLQLMCILHSYISSKKKKTSFRGIGTLIDFDLIILADWYSRFIVSIEDSSTCRYTIPSSR